MGQLFSDTSKKEDNEDLVSSFNEYFKDIKTENKIISQETIDLIKLHLNKGNIHGANCLISDTLRNIDNAPINIAVTGESGVGKSSFINALIGIGPEEEGAAEVGVIETTMKRTSYKHPKIETLTLWDLPGIGTQKFPPKTYLEEVNFKEYDFFIIVSATRFTKLEVDLAKAITIMKKNYYFVRTKVDIDVENERKTKPRTFEREKALKQIQSYSVKVFNDNNMAVPPIFLISNYDLSKYDFPVLMDTLIKELHVQKRHNFILSLPNFTDEAIDRKYKATQQFIWLEAFKIGVVAIFPVLGNLRNKDMEKIKNTLNHYRKIFGVDDESLELVAKDFQVPVEQVKKTMKTPHLWKNYREETFRNNFKKLASAFGRLLAVGCYFPAIYYLQLHILDSVTEDAKVLLRWTYSKPSSNSTYP
ncbi:interferon-inducible GTPase 1-like isoform X1 [Mus caroli]|uniref:Interferon-inducible GTPase 1-like isoform X1 n=1 Tax=Mus caroli TaxID=10089 RepID=A0A6P5NX55_MUSCR|nr:interferon-inducible GTPase 1-like isoform X1 [Mus caroli]